MGSGSLQALGIIESNFKEDMNEEEAIKLAVAAIEAGVYYDLGSGSNVDVVVIKKGKVDYHRNLKSDNFKMFSKPGGFTFKKERVEVLEEYRRKLVVSSAEMPMDLS